MKELKAISKEVRDKVLRYIMVRRTRMDIIKNFSKDMTNQGLFFPELEEPQKIIYKFDNQLDDIFNKTMTYIKKFSYSRYTSLLYLKKQATSFEIQSQKNIGGFMKVILLKMLESSFHAFRKTLSRFIDSYENFILMYNSGVIYISKKINVYDFLDRDDEAELAQLVDHKKVQKLLSTDFRNDYINDLQKDLQLLKKIRDLWEQVSDDPKLAQFINEINSNEILKGRKLIIFTESKETGEYLYENIYAIYQGRVLFYSSEGGIHNNNHINSIEARQIINQSFDPKADEKKDDIQILITTDVLSEGVNLQRSNIVVNYDLPWNPTKVMQRVGRINRIGTQHKNIYIFNLFPTNQSNSELGLETNIKSKLQVFHDTLGEDSKYLTDEEEVSTYQLFGDSLYNSLNDKNNFDDEEA